MSDAKKYDEESVDFLLEAARYFEKRPTDGEDKAYWANVYNAENCRKAAEDLKSKKEEVEGLRTAAIFADQIITKWRMENMIPDREQDLAHSASLLLRHALKGSES
ncbi:hypothetical protein [Thalassospira sp.]|uniref:hypothetical protein n=1 Tax=Thalassospira sp. TaxID=1912094 RepID=UPI001AFDC980|nr:hypothetical protein [Thalassospira sp.]MBO6808450.1 hypothetical protein [Thalassospira sp.]MBO6839852.1 hypothetical protein [Thalassospira sp.]